MLTDAFGPERISLDVVATTAPGDARKYAAKAAEEGVELVVVAGGDGSVNEAANGVAFSETVLGVIPCGSGNGLARSLGLPQDFRKAVEMIAVGKELLIDRGEVNGLPFYVAFGMGFDAAVTKRYSGEKRRGRISYVKSAFQEFLNYQTSRYAIAVNDTVLTENAMVVAVCNAQQYGNNAYIAPGASLCDGLLDITVIHEGNLLEQALAGVQLLTGRLDKNHIVDTFRVPRAEISRLDAGPAHIDGELVEVGRQLEVVCRPAALKVLASSDYGRPFRPVISPLKSAIDDIQSDINALFQ